MDAEVKTEIPDRIKRGLHEVFQLQGHIRALRDIQDAVGYGMLADEKCINKLRYHVSQIALELECIDRVSRETGQAVTELYTTKTSSEDIPF
jgi:hypothetical protein